MLLCAAACAVYFFWADRGGQVVLLDNGQSYTVSGQRSDEAAVPAAGSAAAAGPVNINTADKETLMTLSGIGEKRAEDIIAYREEHGPFRRAEDLKKVSGIGEGTLEKIRDDITVD